MINVVCNIDFEKYIEAVRVRQETDERERRERKREERKRKRDEKRRNGKSREDNNETYNDDGDDHDDMAALMGFSGFGTSKK